MQRIVLLACLVVGLARVLVAQQTAPTFRAGVEVVQLDVSVLDKDRRPMHGLTTADFTILEDGKPQKIVAFTPVDMPEAPPPLPAGAVKWPREVPPDVQTNAVPEGRLFVLLIDDAMIPFEPRIMANARDAARKVIDHLGPTDQMAVLFTDNSAAAQNFTNDREKLLAAVEKLRGGRAGYLMGWDTAPSAELVCRPGYPCTLPFTPSDLHPQLDNDMSIREASLRTLQEVGEALIHAPDHRKALFWVSPGVPVNFAEAGAAVLAVGTGKGMMEHEAQGQLASEVPDLFRRLQRANVAVYPIDPDGVNGLAPYVQGRLNNVGSLRWPDKNPVDSAGHTPVGTVPIIMDLAHFVADLDLDFLEATAANTGGRAIVNTDDFETGIAEIFRETGSYYLVGYQATQPGSGKLHRLSVKVDRPDAEVRTRSSVYESDAKADAKAAKVSPVVAAISGVLPASGLPMQVTLAPFASVGPSGATVAIVLGLSHPASRDRVSGTVDLQTSAFTVAGDARGNEYQTAHVTLMAGGPTETAKYEVLSHIDLNPGRYQLRLAAHSSLENRTGSVFADVDVPDFANAAVSLSGVLLESSPALTAAPPEALASLVPIIPTAERTFDPRDRVSAFLRVYEGGKTLPVPVTLTIHLVDLNGTVVMDREDAISAESVGATTRSADEHISLPIGQLKAGEYLLTIEAALGKTTARRDVRFSVK